MTFGQRMPEIIMIVWCVKTIWATLSLSSWIHNHNNSNDPFIRRDRHSCLPFDHERHQMSHSISDRLGTDWWCSSFRFPNSFFFAAASWVLFSLSFTSREEILFPQMTTMNNPLWFAIYFIHYSVYPFIEEFQLIQSFRRHRHDLDADQMIMMMMMMEGKLALLSFLGFKFKKSQTH